MAELSAEGAEVNAHILYWGPPGAGTSTNVRTVYGKLRADHRGELREVPTPVDPTTRYEVLPIALGEIAGVRVQIHLVAVPGAAEQAPTRKQLLNRVDGIVFVADAQAERLGANLAALDELRQGLTAYGRALEEIPVVVQYNKRDVADAYTLEELHRKLNLRNTATFEAVARDGTGVLQTLTTISKRVIRYLRDHGPEVPAPAPEPQPEPMQEPEPMRVPETMRESPAPVDFDLTEPEKSLEPTASHSMQAALLDEARHPEVAVEAQETTERAQALFDDSWQELRAGTPAANPQALWIESVGDATCEGDHELRVPIVCRDPQGRRIALAVRVRLDLLPGDD